MEIGQLVHACCFYGQKRDCVALTEYEAMMYEQMCGCVEKFCRNQSEKLDREYKILIQENENFTGHEDTA